MLHDNVNDCAVELTHTPNKSVPAGHCTAGVAALHKRVSVTFTPGRLELAGQIAKIVESVVGSSTYTPSKFVPAGHMLSSFGASHKVALVTKAPALFVPAGHVVSSTSSGTSKLHSCGSATSTLPPGGKPKDTPNGEPTDKSQR